MISLSGNQSAVVLLNIANAEFNKMYIDLGMSPPVMPLHKRSAQYYTKFLRTLFNSEYLDVNDSRKALGFMSLSDFNVGIQAGLPSDIKIAHKFGVYEENKELFNLLECGIIYAQRGPYAVCIFTRGSDSNLLRQFLEDSSKDIYSKLTSTN
jgi:hypothetical protein